MYASITGWALLLSIYVASDEVVFGIEVPDHGRRTRDDSNIIPRISFHLRLQREEASDDLVSRVEQEVLGMRKHASQPYDTKACEFHTLVTVRYSGDMATSEDRKEADETKECGSQPFTLALEIIEGGIIATVIFDSSQLDSAQSKRILRQYTYLLEQILMKRTRIADLSLLCDEDKRDLTTLSNQTTWSYQDTCLHDLILKHAATRPEELAICSWDGDMTYRVLNRLTKAAAEQLIQHGLRHGDIVPLCFRKGKWAIVAVLAVSMAGGICVMLDPSYPRSRAEYILAETGAQFVLGNRSCQGLFPNTSFLAIDDGFLDLSHTPDGAVLPLVRGQDTFCIVFTSGSTGASKGCMIEHAAFASMAGPFAARTHLESSSRVLHVASYAFVGGLAEIILVLQVGGCLCVPQEGEHLSRLPDVLRDMQVNWADLNPAMAETLNPLEAVTLKTLLLSGEPPTKMSIEIWAGSATVLNSYGSTESCSAFVISDAPLASNSSPGRIGKPFCGRGWIVDPMDHKSLLPIGAIGELVLEGPGIGRCYFKDPSKTSNSFLTAAPWIHHFGVSANSRLYKTGDLARYEEDGALYMVGRKDTQAKLRGQRLELGEVEHHIRRVLLGFMAVADVIKLRGSTQSTLIAFVPSQQGADEDGTECLDRTSRMLSVNIEALNSTLRGNLPAYMIPSAYISVPDLPLTQSGKIDRKRLREFGMGLSVDQVFASSKAIESISPTTNMERRLQKLWELTFKRPLRGLSVYDNFFQLGGDSLHAVKLISLARQESIRISFSDILKHPTIYHQARVATMVEDSPAQDPLSQLRGLLEDKSQQSGLGSDWAHCAKTIEAVIPATDFQTNILAGELSKCKTEVHLFCLDFDPPINSERLQDALLRFVAFHPSMRTAFGLHGDEVYQFFLKSVPAEVVLTATRDAPKSRTAHITSKVRIIEPEHLIYPLHFTVFNNNGRASRLVFRISHALFDGAIFTRFCKELQQLLSGERLALYTPYIGLIERFAKQRDEGLNYWRKLLSGAQNTALVERVLPAMYHPMKSILRLTVPLPPVASSEVSLSMVLNAAWALTLSDVLRSDDILFGMYVSLRNLGFDDARDTLGCCLNVMPVRVQLSTQHTTVKQLLQAVHSQFIESLPYVAVGEATIIRQCTNWPYWNRFNTLLLHKNEEDFNLEQESLQPFRIDDGERTSTCTGTLPDTMGDFADLEIITVPDTRRRCLIISAYYCEDLLHESMIETLGNIFARNIAALVSSHSSETPVSILQERPNVGIPRCLPQWLERHSCDQVPPEGFFMHSRTIKDAWRSVLKQDNETSTDILDHYPPSRPFWNDWHMIFAYELARYYTATLSIPVSMDDILENPSMNDQMRLLGERVDPDSQ